MNNAVLFAFSSPLREQIFGAIELEPHIIIMCDPFAFNKCKDAISEFNDMMEALGVRTCIIVYGNDEMHVGKFEDIASKKLKNVCDSSYYSDGLTALVISHIIATHLKSGRKRVGIINVSNLRMRGRSGPCEQDDRECNRLVEVFTCKEFEYEEYTMCTTKNVKQLGLYVVMKKLIQNECIVTNIRCEGSDPLPIIGYGFNFTNDAVVRRFDKSNVLVELLCSFGTMRRIVDVNQGWNPSVEELNSQVAALQ